MLQDDSAVLINRVRNVLSADDLVIGRSAFFCKTFFCF